MLYDVTPSIGPPDQGSAPKQRKLDNCSVSPNSMLSFMMSQDQSLYRNNNNNTVTSMDDLAFEDTHATLSVPGDVWVDPTLMKSDATVQEMMDTLQQILGENELTDALEVEPEELKSWESTLLKLSTSCDLSDDLCDILSNDVLTYVEDQLQREGAFQTPDQLAQIPPCVDLQSQTQQSFSWTGEPQNQLLPSRGPLVSQVGAPVCGTVKLTHIDLPQTSSAGLDAPALQLINFQQSSGLQLESCAQEQPRVAGSNLGAFSLQPANQNHCNHMTQPIQNHPAGVQEPNPVFNFRGNHWSSNSSQVDHVLDPYAGHSSGQRGFVANPPASGCLQGHFALRDQNSDHQKQSWSLDQQQQLHHHTSDGPQHVGARLSQRNPLHGAVNGRSLFQNCEPANVPYAAQHGVTSSSCMFGNVAPPAPSCQRMNPTGNQMTSQSSCLYGGVPGGGAVPGMTSVLNPDETALACKTGMALGPEDLLAQAQPYLNVSDNHTQVRAEKRQIQSSSPVFH